MTARPITAVLRQDAGVLGLTSTCPCCRQQHNAASDEWRAEPIALRVAPLVERLRTHFGGDRAQALATIAEAIIAEAIGVGEAPALAPGDPVELAPVDFARVALRLSGLDPNDNQAVLDAAEGVA